MEVVIPMEASQGLHYLSAPSSPKSFGYPSPSSDFYYYTSAPSSPSRVEFSFDQAFGFSGQLGNDESQSAFAAADELFEGGMIRPLIANPPQSHPSLSSPLLDLGDERNAEVRGRSASSVAASHRMGRRSLSPIRNNTEFHQSQAPSSQTGSFARGGGGSKKWRLKDFFLFRSASEGRASGRGSKDLLRKYTLLSSTSSSSDIKYSDNNNGSMRKGRGAATSSPHERHYMMNRAATEEMKKKTPLPFHRNTLFGYLRSNPAIHSISRRWNGCYNNQGRS
ncbi:hypothetical protein LUZ63_008156 [Rhynchospora breviuscula]|uniref:Uncharacterized protein n=1 Tax=Rhynchospora breviuscula TaxID=2022672 RepID=A0A9Q0HV44_9POAL|nr:hypothetical protein LUZ63_008156 [Rhynchospora breviuscula]